MISPIKRTALDNMIVALEGTDRSIRNYCRNHGIEFPLSDEEQEYFDDALFECPSCGYWCRVDDEVDGQCVDCYEEELEEVEGDGAE